MLLGVAISSSLASAQAGTLDPTFGNKGVFVTPPAITFALATSVAFQSDGKIVIAGCGVAPGQGDGPEPAVIRLTAAGTLDTTFGKGGVAIANLGAGGGIIATSVVVQSTGKIVVGIASAFADANPSLQLVRFNGNGTLDTTFGKGGDLIIFSGGPDTAFLLQQPDGKLLLGGGMLMARVSPEGVLDSTFGQGGIVPLVAPAVSVALQSNGEILTVSGANFLPPSQIGIATPNGGMVRYQANGAIDINFGALGRTANAISTTAALQQANGQIVAVGPIVNKALVATFPNVTFDTEFGVQRYNLNGGIDFKFGSHGAALAGFGTAPYAEPNSLAIDSKGNVVAAGQVQPSGPGGAGTESSFAIARFTPAGVLDTTFGTGGTVVTPASTFGTTATEVGIAAIALDSEGRIVAVGSVADNGSSGVINGVDAGRMAVARYRPQ
jgi:uncharacterized delta-60 repeat protein